MKTLILLSGIALTAGLVAVVTLALPVPRNFVHYLWWKATASGVALKGHIRSGDSDIHYRSYGSGPPLLLLHGGLSHSLSWFSQVPWLVDAGRQVILVDSRGHGESSLGHGALSYRLLAADTIRVLDQLDVKRTDVIGWSDGANTALLLARYWPQRVGKIVAISGNSDPSGLTPEARADNETQSSGVGYWFRRWWTGAGERFSELEKRVKRLWRNSPRLQPADLQAITAPTLVIVGEHDQITLDHARRMADLLPHGTLAVIPGGGHATPITQAQQVNALIGNFLGIPLTTFVSRP